MGEDLYELPKGWVWVKFEELIYDNPQNGIYKGNNYFTNESQIRLLDIKGLYQGFQVSFKDCRRCTLTPSERVISCLEMI